MKVHSVSRRLVVFTILTITFVSMVISLTPVIKASEDSFVKPYKLFSENPRIGQCTQEIADTVSLNAAIDCFNNQVEDEHILTFSADIELTQSSRIISNTSTAQLKISGANTYKLDGAKIYRGLHIAAGNVTVEQMTIVNGMAELLTPLGDMPDVLNGGGVYNNGNLTISDSMLTSNLAGNGDFGRYDTTINNGGAIFNSGMLTVTNTLLSNNVANDWGGGIYNEGTTTVVNSTFVDNLADYGGAILNDAFATIHSSSFSDNSSRFGGGGIATGGNAETTINTSTFVNNSVLHIGYGGAIRNSNLMEISNSTLSSNSARFGGGFVNFGSATIRNTTITENSAQMDGGGIYNNEAVNVVNSIVALNSSGGDCANVAPTFSHSIVGDGSCGITSGQNGNLTGDPKIAQLQNNGGSTSTHALKHNSPALDSGDFAICSVYPVNNLDQRRFPHDGNCDMGSYELDKSLLPCSATHDNGVTVQASLDATAVQSATLLATNGGTVKVAGTCIGVQEVMVGGVSSKQSVVVSKPMTLQGGHTISDWTDVPDSSQNPTIIDANGMGRVVVIVNGDPTKVIRVVLDNLTLSNGIGDNAALTGKDEGGGVLIGNGVEAIISNSSVTDNTASDGGGVSNHGEVLFDNSTLSNNAAQNGVGGGGGLFNRGVATFDNSVIQANTARIFGGGIFNEEPYLVAPFTYFSPRVIIKNGTTMVENSAKVGSGVFNMSELNIQNSTLNNNTNAESNSGGGVIYNRMGTALVNNSTFSGNSAQFGGVIYNFSIAIITNSTLSENSAENGGVFFNDADGNIMIVDSTMQGNTVFFDGGTIFNYGEITLKNSTLLNNNANDDGGAISNSGTLKIYNSTLSNNSTNFGDGGGIYNDGGTALISSSTLSHNGLGIRGVGAGIANLGDAEFVNSIIANSLNGDDCAHRAPIFNHSLVEDTSCGVQDNVNGNIVADPKLDSINDNGGRTLTHAPGSDSPVIGNGDASICSNSPIHGIDQRRMFRGPVCDIGAYEYDSIEPAGYIYLPLVIK